MNDIEPERSGAKWLKWSDRHSGAFFWGGSLILKLVFLGTGVCFVYWVGWPNPPLAPVPQVSTSHPGVLLSHTVSSGSADYPDEVLGEAPLPGKNVVPPLQAVVEGEQSQPREVAAVTVDLNDGTSAELAHLPGIGPVLAGRIVAHRTSHGAFRRIKDLVLVPGIGAKRVEQLRPFVRVRASTRVIGIGR